MATSPTTRHAASRTSSITLEELASSSSRIQENNVDTVIAAAQRTFGSAYQLVPPMSVTLGMRECLSAQPCPRVQRHRGLEADGAPGRALLRARCGIPDDAPPASPRRDRHCHRRDGRSPDQPASGVGARVIARPGRGAVVGVGALGWSTGLPRSRAIARSAATRAGPRRSCRPMTTSSSRSSSPTSRSSGGRSRAAGRASCRSVWSAATQRAGGPSASCEAGASTHPSSRRRRSDRRASGSPASTRTGPPSTSATCMERRRR